MADLKEIAGQLEKLKDDINENTEEVIKQKIAAINTSILLLFEEQNEKIENLREENVEL